MRRSEQSERTHSHHNRSKHHNGDKSSAAVDKSLEERESEYAKARARIFNEATPIPPPTQTQATKPAAESGVNGVKLDSDKSKKVEKKEVQRNRKYSQQPQPQLEDPNNADDFPVMDTYARHMPEFWSNNQHMGMQATSQHHPPYEAFEYFNNSEYGNPAWEEPQMHNMHFPSNPGMIQANMYGMRQTPFVGNSNNINTFYPNDNSDYMQSGPPPFKGNAWRGVNTGVNSNSGNSAQLPFLHSDWPTPQLNANSPAFEPGGAPKRATTPPSSQAFHTSSPSPAPRVRPRSWARARA
jgi:hypothetical protein